MEEQNVVQETVNTDAETTKENEEKDTLETTNESTDEVDYKAELEKAQNLLKQKDSIISHKEDVIKAEKEKNKTQVDDDDEDVSDKFAELTKKQQEELETFKYSVLEDKIDEEISKYAGSEDEAKLIEFHLKNSVKFGYNAKEVKGAVKSAWLLANERKILNTNSELANSLKARASLNTSASSSGQAMKTDTEPQYSGKEKEIIDYFSKKGKAITDSAVR